jgi:hypothetical protein
MGRDIHDEPAAPFFEFTPTEPGWAYVFDKPGHLHQLEAPEFEERGPDHVFDSGGRLAELAVEDFLVVIKKWSAQPMLELFDMYLRSAASRYMPGADVSRLGTFELRDRLEEVLRHRQLEKMPFRRLARLVRRIWTAASGRSA